MYGGACYSQACHTCVSAGRFHTICQCPGLRSVMRLSGDWETINYKLMVNYGMYYLIGCVVSRVCECHACSASKFPNSLLTLRNGLGTFSTQDSPHCALWLRIIHTLWTNPTLPLESRETRARQLIEVFIDTWKTAVYMYLSFCCASTSSGL
jgi:hypothetical protein